MDITILEREGVQYMTIYDYSDLLKMIANINTDKIIAKNERTMNNKNRLAKMENKLLSLVISILEKFNFQKID